MATGRFLLIAFSSKTKIQISNWISVSKAGSAGANRSVSYCGVAACTESAFLPLCCSGVVRLARILCGVVERYPDPDGLCSFQSAGMKNCRPVVRLQILWEYKENRPARDQRILSGISGGKMVRCGCGAAEKAMALYFDKVV